MKLSLKVCKKYKQEGSIPFFYKEALSEMLCLFNSNCMCNMADGKLGCRGDANSTLNCNWRKCRPCTTNLLRCASQNIM